jgi:hypothetical protein
MADRVVFGVFTVMLSFMAVVAVCGTVDYASRIALTTTAAETLVMVASASFTAGTAIFSAGLALVAGVTAIRG